LIDIGGEISLRVGTGNKGNGGNIEVSHVCLIFH